MTITSFTPLLTFFRYTDRIVASPVQSSSYDLKLGEILSVMSKTLHHLNPKVKNAILASVQIPNFHSAIERAIENSLKAGSNNVSVIIDPYNFDFVVIDNGNDNNFFFLYFFH